MVAKQFALVFDTIVHGFFSSNFACWALPVLTGTIFCDPHLFLVVGQCTKKATFFCIEYELTKHFAFLVGILVPPPLCLQCKVLTTKAYFDQHIGLHFLLGNAFGVTVIYKMLFTGHHPHADQGHAAGPIHLSFPSAVVAVIATAASVAVGVAAGKCLVIVCSVDGKSWVFFIFLTQVDSWHLSVLWFCLFVFRWCWQMKLKNSVPLSLSLISSFGLHLIKFCLEVELFFTLNPKSIFSIGDING